MPTLVLVLFDLLLFGRILNRCLNGTPKDTDPNRYA